ncbi:MAG: multidrug efflux system membrane fusion protein [Myxococcota bacterium]|jgi:multidrug efflux system membrane fusion protein
MYRPTFAFAFVLLTALTLMAPACGDEAGPPPEPYIRPVRVMNVTVYGGEYARSYTGRSQAGMASQLSFKVSGTLQVLHVKVGDVVAVGAPIADLDPSDLELQVQEAKASAGQVSAESRNARAEFKRAQKLYESNSISRSALDAARTRSSAAGATVSAASKRVELAKAQVGYTKLTSALAGSVAGVMAEVNENVKAGQAIVVVASGGKPEVVIGIPEQLIGGVSSGMRSQIRFDAVPERAFEGVVTEVGVRPDEKMGTFQVTIQLTVEDKAVRPGMSANVTLNTAKKAGPPVYLVPAVAVSGDRTGRFVYIVEPGADGLGVAKRLAVTTGALRAEGLEVKTGIEPGQTLVIAGTSKIKDGMTVRLPLAMGTTEAPAP